MQFLGQHREIVCQIQSFCMFTAYLLCSSSDTGSHCFLLNVCMHEVPCTRSNVDCSCLRWKLNAVLPSLCTQTLEMNKVFGKGISNTYAFLQLKACCKRGLQSVCGHCFTWLLLQQSRAVSSHEQQVALPSLHCPRCFLCKKKSV